ncbi:MAG TPA: PQQ-dependent sugar dehydrogenase [Blastocatellia bacterium]|nr:PQQ-dependent sugar dehydrogenase [Blastocatellia bacterium]
MKKVIASFLAALGVFSIAYHHGSPRDAEVRAQSGPRIELEPVLSGLTSPLYVTSARDGSDRLFIVEQPGRILVLQPGATTATVFLNIAEKVSFGGERGLLGLAFHPQYPVNRRFFVNYTRRQDGATVIAEYRVSAANPNVAETNETVLLTVPQPFANHNGGMIEFGPDGHLYIGMGDGGSANDPGNRAQNINDLLGKMLRIDVDRPDGATPYSSPSNNPFFGATAGRDEIYAIGLRNPFRFSFDRETGDLYAGDVGQGVIEEIDIITRGGNYGWRVFEGTQCTNIDPPLCNRAGFTPPIAEYRHTGGRCSITGGYVYRGARATLPLGAYVYGDFCSGEIFMLNGGAQTLLLDTDLNISSFGEDEAGEIYVVGLGGQVRRIVNPNQPPPPPVFRITSVSIQRRSTGEPLDPVTVKNNGKKYEAIVAGEGFSAGDKVVINGRELKTQVLASTSPDEEIMLAGRLRRGMLRQPGQLVVEVVRPDGARTAAVTIPIVADQ